jgi:tight adherence protein B
MTSALLLAVAVLVHPHADRSRLRIRRSPRRWRPPGPILVVVAGLAAALMVVQLPLTTVVSALLVAGTVWSRRRGRRTRVRARREGDSLSSALELLVAELRAGAHPVRAFEVAATEIDGPVGSGLRMVAARARLGADVAAGLRTVAAHSRLPRQWEQVAACWQLAADHGVPIGVLMRAAQLDIAERHRYAAQVDAGMAGARATAAILAALPVLGVVLGELLGAASTMFLTRGAGGWVLVAGVGLLCAGVLWSGRITDRLPT